MKHRSLVIVNLAAIALTLFAPRTLAVIIGTTQHFSGFSSDNRNYLHLESYREPSTSVPQAQIQIIDIYQNSCVKNGCLHSQNSRDAINQTQKETAESLYQKTWVLRQTHYLNNLRSGTRLPLAARKVNPNKTETFTFRLPNRKLITVNVQQNYIPSTLYGGTSDVDKASLQLEINSNQKTLTLGSLYDYRDAILKYEIREARLAPDGKSIVLLINANKQSVSGIVKTTLVQSFPVF